MIKLSMKLPRKFTIAVSGGVDSMTALHFLSRNHDVSVIHFNHSEGNSDSAEDLVRSYCVAHNLHLQVYRSSSPKPANCSREEHWRNERYKVFHNTNDIILTAHTLDDVVETWIWSSLNGCGKLIPTANRNVIRPFLQTRKNDFEHHANKHSVPYVVDESNADLTLVRNYIRQVLLPNALYVNPGIHKTILKKVKTNG